MESESHRRFGMNDGIAGFGNIDIEYGFAINLFQIRFGAESGNKPLRVNNAKTEVGSSCESLDHTILSPPHTCGRSGLGVLVGYYVLQVSQSRTFMAVKHLERSDIPSSIMYASQPGVETRLWYSC